MELDNEKRFEALKLRYSDQTELAKFMKQNELKIVFGFLTVQFVLTGWVTRLDATPEIFLILGVVAVDFITALSINVMLVDYKRRRDEVISTIKNINKALRFDVEGFYLDGAKINPDPPQMTTWSYWYILIIWMSFGAATITIEARYL